MFNWIVNTIAGFFHVSSAELSKLEGALPATKKLVELFNKHQNLIVEFQAFEKEVSPVINEALVEWKTVGPALVLLIDILERNKKRGITTENTITNLKMRLEPKF